MTLLRKGFASAIVTAAAVPMFGAGSECPKTADSLPFRLIASSQIVVRVTLNHLGPYDFLLDTGAQISTVDPQVVVELKLPAEGNTNLVSVGSRQKVQFTRLASLEAGPHQVADLPVVILELKQLQAVDHRVRGILGGDFLRHFDTLIDYKHHVVCLSGSGLMGPPEIKGIHLAVLMGSNQEDGADGTELLAIPIRLAGESGLRRVLLDSGTNVPFLYRSSRDVEAVQVTQARDVSGTEATFDTLAPQSIQIGSVTYHQVAFASLRSKSSEAGSLGIDGMLPTAMFRRVYVSYKEHFVVLEPW